MCNAYFVSWNHACVLLFLEYKLSEQWDPAFYDYPSLTTALGPRAPEFQYGPVKCEANEHPFRIHEVDPKTDDRFRLLVNGSLSHKGSIREFHQGRSDLLENYFTGELQMVAEEDTEQSADTVEEGSNCSLSKQAAPERLLYPPEKYCIDDMIIDYKSTNATPVTENVRMNKIYVQFATICIHYEGVGTMQFWKKCHMLVF